MIWIWKSMTVRVHCIRRSVRCGKEENQQPGKTIRKNRLLQDSWGHLHQILSCREPIREMRLSVTIKHRNAGYNRIEVCEAVRCKRGCHGYPSGALYGERMLYHLSATTFAAAFDVEAGELGHIYSRTDAENSVQRSTAEAKQDRHEGYRAGDLAFISSIRNRNNDRFFIPYIKGIKSRRQLVNRPPLQRYVVRWSPPYHACDAWAAGYRMKAAVYGMYKE